MEVKFHYSALLEYNSAIDYYNTQLKGLGNRFVKEVDQYLQIIKKYPHSFPQYSSNTRKASLNTFPFNIVYGIHNNIIVVFAIAHQHRYPNYWKGR